MSNTILMIAEKPSQADNIADAFKLSSIKESVEVKKGVSQDIKFHNGSYNGNEIILISTKGHLLELRGRSSDILYFDFTWKKPTLKNPEKLARYLLIKKYIKTAVEVAIATDSDDEGELIGYNIVREFKALGMTKRMMFVSMTEKSLQKSFTDRAILRLNIAKAAELRTWMDKVFGYIFSKYLTQAYCSVTNAAYIQLPVGRVMTPALRFIIDNAVAIEVAKKKLADYTPEVVYDVELTADMPLFENHAPDAKEIKIEESTYGLTLKEAKKLNRKYSNLKGIIVEVSKSKYKTEAPKSGLTIDDIRVWAYRKGIEYTRADAILEALYLNKLISYPRSESRILPKESEYHKEILQNCLKYLGLEHEKSLVEKDVPNMGTEYDGAHYAIHPTEIKPSKLPADYSMIYEKIVKCYVKGFCKPVLFWEYACSAVFRLKPFSKRFSIDFENKIGFIEVLTKETVYWQTIIEYGYKIVGNSAYLHYKEPEHEIIPKVNKGDIVNTEISMSKRLDIPRLPDRVKKSNLFDYMKKNELGTDATRTMILEKLWDVNMVRGDPPFATVLGLRIFDAIKDINPRLTEAELTKQFEHLRKEVETEKRDIDEIKDVVKSEITNIISGRLNDLNAIGTELAYFGECQKCKSRMKLVSWNKNAEFLFFLACENEECSFTSPI